MSTQPIESSEWRQARRTAFLQDALAALTNRPADLLSFEEVRQKLHLRNVRYLGLQNVPLAQIVGSVGRYRDFTRAFFPRQDELSQRWQHIERLTNIGGGLPPVELYKVGQIFFVHDGHHRVSVARQLQSPTIQAYVWEYETRVSLEPQTDVKDLWVKAAYATFLEHTDLDGLCLSYNLELSDPEGYTELLHEIIGFQQNISLIDGQTVPFDQAVALWCEMHYAPIVQIIRQQDILVEFPGRTETDLYLWLRRHQEELEMRYSQRVMLEEAADDLARRFAEKPSPVSQFKRVAERLAEEMGEWSGRLAESIAPGGRDENDAQAATALMAAVRQAIPEMPLCRFQGTSLAQWETWRQEFGQRLWNLLGVGDWPWQPRSRDDLSPTVAKEVDLGGLQRRLVWLRTEPELRVPLYLFIPKTNEPLPTVLVFPGHGTIAQTAGLRRSYQRANALALARAGFVTLTIELRGFGMLSAMGHLQIDAAARLVGRTWYGLLVHDALCAIDYLQTCPEVDTDRIGAAGIGTGGALTLYTAALDERVQVALVNSYLGKYVVTCLDEEHCPCNDIPGILRYAEMGDVAALIAPRPVMFVNGRRDPSTTLAARESFTIIRQMFSFLGLPQRTKLIEPENLGHHFDNQLAINWFRRWLSQRWIGKRTNRERENANRTDA
ncbi:MAG: dienelactone hydrolase family protein [Chloroflexota bacterium]